MIPNDSSRNINKPFNHIISRLYLTMKQYHNYVKIQCPDDFVTERVIMLNTPRFPSFHEELKSMQNVGFYVLI